MNQSSSCQGLNDGGSTIDMNQVNSVGQLLSEAARLWPDHPAVAEPDGPAWRSVSFRELERRATAAAATLVRHGVGPGQVMALLVPPGIRFVEQVFALFKTGASIVLIDPGIGRRNMIRCLQSTNPDGFVGIAKAHVARWVFRKRFPSARRNFVVGRRAFPGCVSLDKSDAESSPGSEAMPAVLPRLERDDAAAIIFTSGSTGPPKGVCYTQNVFITQAQQVRDWFGIAPGGADISGFPLFALFNSAMGKTTVFPKMDFTRPASVKPEAFLAAVEHFSADQSFGSPALWTTVGRWATENGRRVPSIQRVMTAGAPVPDHVLKRVRRIIASDGEVYTPYGATEALPIACNTASEVLGETAALTHKGRGVCVGKRFPGIDWRVVEITDDPIETWAQAVEIHDGRIGELVVSGPVVTRTYHDNPQANKLAKILDGDEVWHRMGDVGHLDAEGRFWFCGRKTQRVQTSDRTLFTVPLESIVNTHPAIYRSALVGVGEAGNQVPCIVAEPWPEHWPTRRQRRQRLIEELKGLCQDHELTRPVAQIFLKRRLPVDIRHNSKIFREQLRVWAASRMKDRTD